MRLNGRQEILMYLGRNTRNKKTWRRLRARYAAVILCEPTSGRLWAISEDLDAVDRARCVPMTEFLERGPKGEHVGEGVGSMPPEFQRLVRDLYPGLARKRKQG